MLRLGAVRPAGDPTGLIRRGPGGQVAFGAVRLREDPWRAEDRIDRLAAALAAGAFDAPTPVAPLEGAYALAFWSHDKGLRLLRDAMGAAPLWLADLSGGALAFATWPHALRALPEVGADPDPERLRQLTLFRRLPPGRSLWPGMTELPAGHLAEADPAGLSLRRWWAPGPDPRLAGLSDAATTEAVADRVSLATSRHWEALGPGSRLLFSGGLDSSLLAGLLCAADPGREVAALVSVGAGGGGAADRAARTAMARRWPNLRAVEAPATGLDPFEGAEQRWHADAAPNWDFSFFNTLALVRQAEAGGASGVMTGFGGDQVISLVSRGALSGALRGLRPGEARRSWRALRRHGLRPRTLAVAVLRSFPQLNKVLRPKARLTDLRALALDPAAAAAREVAWAAEGLVLDDRLPASRIAEETGHLLEVPALGLQPIPLGPGAALAQAAPLLDTDVTAAVMAVSGRVTIAGGVERALMRRLLSQVAPAEVAQRRGKDPFQPDMARLMRAGLPRLRAELRGFATDLPIWREVVDEQALAARLSAAESMGSERGMVMLATGYQAWFLGRFLALAAGGRGATPPA